MGTQNGKTNGETKETLIIGLTSQGVEIHATLLRLTRYIAVFEIYNSGHALRTSEVLNDFKIVVRDRVIYSGSVVVHSLVSTGLVVICEVMLNEIYWRDVEFTSDMLTNGKLGQEF